MKFVMDERLKHRLTGLIVILSIAAIFLPAVVKKSNQRFEENVSFSVRLPAKPVLPDVAVTDEKKVFQSVKVARVDLPVVEEVKPIQIAKAEPISIPSSVAAAPVSTLVKLDKNPNVIREIKKPILAKKNIKPALVKVAKVVAPAVKAAGVPKKVARAALSGVRKEVYAVQLASFAQRGNALALVTSLRNKGYKASYNASNNKQGLYYKVIVGNLNERHEAEHLQKQLSDSMQLKGFIIKTGVS